MCCFFWKWKLISCSGRTKEGVSITCSGTEGVFNYTSWVWHSDSACSNVLKLLAHRELCPQTKRTPRRFWRKASVHHGKSSGSKCELAKDVRQELQSWYSSFLFSPYCIYILDYIMPISRVTEFVNYIWHTGERQSHYCIYQLSIVLYCLHQGQPLRRHLVLMGRHWLLHS